MTKFIVIKGCQHYRKFIVPTIHVYNSYGNQILVTAAPRPPNTMQA